MNNPRQRCAATFRSAAELFHADTCEPLEAAASQGEVRVVALGRGSYPGRRLPANDLREVRSVGFWDARGKQTWGLDWHRNEGIELTFLAAGRLPFSVDGRPVTLEPGDLTITRPWQKHRVGDPRVTASRLIWLILDVGVRRPNQEWRWPHWLTLTPADRAELTRKLRHSDNAVWKSSPGIAAAFRGLSAGVLQWREPFVESRMIALLNQLLLGILEALTEQQTPQNPELATRRRAVELFLRDLAENAASSSEPWTLAKMAAHCGMGITVFSKYCRELVNNGPVEYLNRRRLERAARLLRANPEQSVTEIAFESGFNSSQYFATAFRGQYRMSPREYRERG